MEKFFLALWCTPAWKNNENLKSKQKSKYMNMNSRASGDIISRTSVPARNPDFCNIILLQTSNIPAFFYTKDTFIFSGWSEILQDRWCKFAGLQKSWCSVLPFHFHLSRLSVSELIDGCNLQAAVPKTYLDVRCSTFTFTFHPFTFAINRLFQFSLSRLIYYPNFQASCFDTALSLFFFILSLFQFPGLLFHRVILMSGSALSPWARATNPHNTSKVVVMTIIMVMMMMMNNSNGP